MGKYLTYKRNSKEYENIINEFLEDIETAFPGYYQKETLRKMLYQNLKSIKKLKDGPSIKLPVIGYVNGLYHRIMKKLFYTENSDETIKHELFHALSNKSALKRENIFKIIAIVFLGQKQLSQREFEEGITEYLTGSITDKVYKYNGLEYQIEKTVVNKLAYIYGDKVILDYYLGINNNLIKLINKNNPNNFKNLNKTLRKSASTGYLPDNFEGIKYPNKQNEFTEDNLIYSLFEKEKLRKVETIDDFKHNLHELFGFYESDLYRVCYAIVQEENVIAEKEEDNDKLMFSKHNLNKALKEFQKFYNIIMKEFQKLGIDNKNLLNDLILEEINLLDEYLKPIIIDYLEHWDISLSRHNENKNAESPTKKENSNKKELEELKKELIETANHNQTLELPQNNNIPRHK